MKQFVTILITLVFNTLMFGQSDCGELRRKGENYATSDSNPKTWCEIAATTNTPYTKCMCEEEKEREVERNERNRKDADRKAIFDRNREKKKQIDALKKEASEYAQEENYDKGLAQLREAKSIAETYEDEPKIEMRGYKQYSKREKISWIQESIDSMQRAKENSGGSLSLKLSSSTGLNREEDTNYSNQTEVVNESPSSTNESIYQKRANEQVQKRKEAVKRQNEYLNKIKENQRRNENKIRIIEQAGDEITDYIRTAFQQHHSYKNFRQKIESLTTISKSSDPNKIIREYKRKIAGLEREFNKRLNERLSQISKEAAKIKSSDAAYAKEIGAIGELASRGIAQKQIKKAKKKAKEDLKDEKRWMLEEIQTKLIKEFREKNVAYVKKAAAEIASDKEKYYELMADFYDCKAKGVKNNFSINSTSWINPNCIGVNRKTFKTNYYPTTEELYEGSIRKLKKYKESNSQMFHDAAVSYVTLAAKTKPCAKYFYQLANCYDGRNNILTLSYYMAANDHDKNFFNKEQTKRFNELKKSVELEISTAIQNNNKSFINAFLSARIDRVIKINNKSILNYAIKLDQPESMQIILNKDIEGKTKNDAQYYVEKAIMLCVVSNSIKCMQLLINEGVSVDFLIDKHTPIDIAVEVKAEEVLALLLEHTSRKEYYKEIMAKSFIYQKNSIKRNLGDKKYENAANYWSNIEDKSFKNKLINYLVYSLMDAPSNIEFFKYSVKAVAELKKDAVLSSTCREVFYHSFYYSSNKSLATFIELDLIDFENKLKLKEKDVKYIKENLFKKSNFRNLQETNCLLGAKTRGSFVKKIIYERNENDERHSYKSYKVKAWKYVVFGPLSVHLLKKQKAKKAKSNKLLNKIDSTSFIRNAIYKGNNDLIRALDNKYDIDWNEPLNGDAGFLLLAQTMNWELLNELFERESLDYKSVDYRGNTVFHYIAEYYWVNRKNIVKSNQVTMPNKLFSALYSTDFKRNVLKIKNKDNKTAWSVFKKKRKSLDWSDSFEDSIEPFLK